MTDDSTPKQSDSTTASGECLEMSEPSCQGNQQCSSLLSSSVVSSTLSPFDKSSRATRISYLRWNVATTALRRVEVLGSRHREEAVQVRITFHRDVDATVWCIKDPVSKMSFTFHEKNYHRPQTRSSSQSQFSRCSDPEASTGAPCIRDRCRGVAPARVLIKLLLAFVLIIN